MAQQRQASMEAQTTATAPQSTARPEGPMRASTVTRLVLGAVVALSVAVGSLAVLPADNAAASRECEFDNATFPCWME